MNEAGSDCPVVLVCGGRDFCDYPRLCEALDEIPGKTVIVQGGYRGADLLAKRYAKDRKLHCAEVPALWDDFRTAAGPRRNRAMILLKPDLVVAFPGGSGTRDMVNVARTSGVRVWSVGTEVPR